MGASGWLRGHVGRWRVERPVLSPALLPPYTPQARSVLALANPISPPFEVYEAHAPPHYQGAFYTWHCTQGKQWHEEEISLDTAGPCCHLHLVEP